jgi:hypothetical protein
MLLLLAAMAGAGCRRSSPGAAIADAAPTPVVADAANAAASASEAIFSAPIAGARVAAGDVIAAGLVVATRTITAKRIDAGGKAVWTRAIVPDVSWSADAELHAWPIAAGAAIVWRGPTGKKSGHVVVVLGADGHVIDGPMAVGSLVCATSDGLAWSEGATGGTTRVRLRSYGSSGAVPPGRSAPDAVGPALTDDFTLSCGDHVAYEAVEGDEGSPTRAYQIGGGGGPAAFATIASASLGADEERDLFPWVEGDALGFVRIASSGEVHAAEVKANGAALLRADAARVAPEDDVVAVDADAQQVVLVTTHDATDQCPNGRGGASVHALRLARSGGAAAASLPLAPSACETDVGPFWTNTLGTSLVVGWAERASRADKTSAPITGIAFRRFQEGSTTGRLAQSADAVADAGCDGARCYAVALVRTAGSDGMKPEEIRVLTYP